MKHRQSTANSQKVTHLRQMPNVVEAEAEVLSACLLGGMSDVAKQIGPDDFYRQAHRVIFQAMADMHEAGSVIDPVTVMTRLKELGHLEDAGGASAIAALTTSIPAAVNLAAHCDAIRRAALRRSIITRCNEIAQQAFDSPELDTVLEQTRQLSTLDACSTDAGQIFTGYRELAEILPAKWEKIGQGLTGVTTGFKKIDELTGGFQATDLIVIAARPSMGKSALMINIAEGAARNGFPVCIFSLEMSAEQLYQRQTSRTARVDSRAFRNGGFSPKEWQQIMDAQAVQYEIPIYIDESAMLTAKEIYRRSRLAVEKLGAKMVIVDHLQKIRDSGQYQRKDLEVGYATQMLKAAAKELGIPLILLCQLNRKCEERAIKIPEMGDLRESGAIEQDADIVAFLYRDEYYNENTTVPGTGELHFAKHRNGPTGKVMLTWIAWRQSFENYIPSFDHKSGRKQ